MNSSCHGTVSWRWYHPTIRWWTAYPSQLWPGDKQMLTYTLFHGSWGAVGVNTGLQTLGCVQIIAKKWGQRRSRSTRWLQEKSAWTPRRLSNSEDWRDVTVMRVERGLPRGLQTSHENGPLTTRPKFAFACIHMRIWGMRIYVASGGASECEDRSSCADSQTQGSVRKLGGMDMRLHSPCGVAWPCHSLQKKHLAKWKYFLTYSKLFISLKYSKSHLEVSSSLHAHTCRHGFVCKL